MDLHYHPDAPHRRVRDGAKASEIARQRPALTPRVQGCESYQDFDAQHVLRGGHYTDEPRHMDEIAPKPVKHFVMNEEEACDRMNTELRRGHTLNVVGDSDYE